MSLPDKIQENIKEAYRRLAKDVFSNNPSHYVDRDHHYEDGDFNIFTQVFDSDDPTLLSKLKSPLEKEGIYEVLPLCKNGNKNPLGGKLYGKIRFPTQRRDLEEELTTSILDESVPAEECDYMMNIDALLLYALLNNGIKPRNYGGVMAVCAMEAYLLKQRVITSTPNISAASEAGQLNKTEKIKSNLLKI